MALASTAGAVQTITRREREGKKRVHYVTLVIATSASWTANSGMAIVAADVGLSTLDEVQSLGNSKDGNTPVFVIISGTTLFLAKDAGSAALIGGSLSNAVTVKLRCVGT